MRRVNLVTIWVVWSVLRTDYFSRIMKTNDNFISDSLFKNPIINQAINVTKIEPPIYYFFLRL